MFTKIKNFFSSNKEVEKKNLKSLDNETFQTMRLNKKGSLMIQMTMTMHINAMAEQFPEWKGLFDVCIDHNDDVLVKCLKGFEDKITRQAIPCLWQRKSFIENCTLAGVDKIIFLDPIANTFDLLEVNKVDISKLP